MSDRAPAPGGDPGVVRLPRGGTIVRTSMGAVQFGAPPETIKDALAAGLEPPAIYVLPASWFSRTRGVTRAELEFPVYYNYFVLGRRVTAVCDADGRRRLRAVLQESLFGPDGPPSPLDWDPGAPARLRPDLPAECEWFRRQGAGGKRIELDDVVAFAIHDADGVADLGGGVRIARIHGGAGIAGWRVLDGDRVVAEVPAAGADAAEVAPRPARAPASPFEPPLFGITVLGSSHGFDPAGKTTGFVLWVNRRGILVDPPTDATATLQAAGVPARHVETVILTHCHADHDAGVFQKVLEDRRVDLFTTPTILGSFLRKYVALTGEPEERLRRLFVYRPVAIGAPIRIQGAEFRFFYSLHAIPTIGFECWAGGKSLVYSSDTLYDPPRIERMHEEGVLSAARRDALLRFPWHHSLVLHEAGVPPIHTPAEVLAGLPPHVKQRLRIIHIAEADLPRGAGLRLARTGFEHTIELPVAPPRHAEAAEALEALAGIELFRDLSIARARELLGIARRETHPAGALLIGQGEPGDTFYVILKGEAAVVRDGAVIRTWREGDFFGETALVTGAPRSADVRARTDLAVLAIDKHDFLSFLRGTDLVEALVRLARNRELPSWDLMDRNAVLGALSDAQRTQLQALLEPVDVAAGEVLWEEGAEGGALWLLDTAEAAFEEPGVEAIPLGAAAVVGDLDDALGRGRPRPARPARAVVTRAGRAFRLPAAGLAGFVENNPRFLLSLSGTGYLE